MEIQFEHVAKKYGTTEVLHDISLAMNLNGGQVFGLIGPNGAGKSTLMRLLSGITTSNGGKLSISDQEGHSYAQWGQRQSFYVAAGDRGLRNKLTPLENLRYFSALRGEYFSETRARLQKNAERFHAGDLINQEFDHMSTGQKKKATLLVAISFSTPLLLLDEPSNGLDMAAQVELMQLIDAIAHQGQQTIILSSHDPVLMSEVATQYLFIEGGRLIGSVDHDLSETALRQKYDQLFREGTV